MTGLLTRLQQTATVRFVLLQLLMTTVAALFVFPFLAWRTERLVESELRQSVAEEIARVARRFQSGGLPAAVAEIGEIRADGSSDRLAVRLEASGGRAVSANIAAWPPVVTTVGGWQTLSLYRIGEGEPRTFGLSATRLGAGGARLLLGHELDQRQAVLRILYESLALGIAMTLVAGLVTGVVHARYTLGQLGGIATSAEAIMAGDADGRITLAGSDDEFDRLGGVLNRLLDQQGRQRREIEAIATSLAHDIRTPLARMRQSIEAARAGSVPATATLDRIDGETSRLLAMVTTLLETARARSGVGRERFTSVDVSELIAELAELYAPVGADAGMPITATVAPGLAIEGNRQLLAQAVINLIENALRHAQGSDGVALAATATATGLAITVADHGPGIAAADRGEVAKAFVRLDPSRSGDGHGLGMSLVAAVAELHGGTLTLADNQPGLAATLNLPAGRRV